MPDVKEQLVKFGFEPFPNTPEEAAVELKSERTKWLGVIRAANPPYGVRPAARPSANRVAKSAIVR